MRCPSENDGFAIREGLAPSICTTDVRSLLAPLVLVVLVGNTAFPTICGSVEQHMPARRGHRRTFVTKFFVFPHVFASKEVGQRDASSPSISRWNVRGISTDWKSIVQGNLDGLEVRRAGVSQHERA